MKRTLSTKSSDENSSSPRKKNNQSPVVDLLIEAIKEDGNEKNEDEVYRTTIDEASNSLFFYWKRVRI
jgi:enolase